MLSIESENSEQLGEINVAGKSYPIKRGRNTIGRNKNMCDIIIDCPSISRVHATIHASSNETRLMDLNSRGCTKIGDTVLTPFQGYVIENGSLIMLGNEMCYFRTLAYEDDDLPMTQADEVHETPISKSHETDLAVSETPEGETSNLNCIVGFNKTVGPDYDVSLHEMETQNPFLTKQQSPILNQKRHSQLKHKSIKSIDNNFVEKHSSLKSKVIDNTNTTTIDSDQEICLNDEPNMEDDFDIENSQILIPEFMKSGTNSEDNGQSEPHVDKALNDSVRTDSNVMRTRKLPPVANCELMSTEININNHTKEDIQLMDTQIIPELSVDGPNNQGQNKKGTQSMALKKIEEDIHLMDTQVISPKNDQEDIHLMDTQIILPESPVKTTEDLPTLGTSAYDQTPNKKTPKKLVAQNNNDMFLHNSERQGLHTHEKLSRDILDLELPSSREIQVNIQMRNKSSKEKYSKSGQQSSIKLSDKSLRVKTFLTNDRKSLELVRRSNRQRRNQKGINYREARMNKRKEPKNASTIYNNSIETSNNLSPNRSQIICNQSSEVLSTPSRMDQVSVLFSVYSFNDTSKLEKLGAQIVDDISKSSVLVVGSLKRTYKVLCAFGLGIPIVGESWIESCFQFGFIVDPWEYLLKDEEAERRHQFNLKETLTNKRRFLRGYNISSTPNVNPGPVEMKSIVEYSGGVWREGGNRWLCVTSLKDKDLWPRYRLRGATLVSCELLLTGVLRQSQQIDDYIIHPDKI